MLDKLSDLEKELQSITFSSPAEVEQFRIKYLSKKGIFSSLFEEFKDVPVSEKKETGKKLNLLKQWAIEKFNSSKDSFSLSDNIAEGTDLTRPAFPFSPGSRHPISIVRNEIIDIF